MELKGKNILVTGGTGFIGSHLVEKLISKDANIIVPYQALNPKSYFFSKKLNKKTILVQKDLKNFKRTLDIITKHEVDFIFHLAAQSIVPTAFHNPLETFETNIMGTANLLEASRLYGKVSGIIVVSSDKAYGKIPKASEANSLSGDHPYETSKSSADLIASTYVKTYKLPVVITRLGNVYGEGDLNFSRIIPGMLRAIIKKEQLHLRSNGKFVRDYVYVEDIVGGLLTIAHNLRKVAGEVFNLSSRESFAVIELMKRIEKLIGIRVKYKIVNNAVNEIPIQSINFDKITKLLGWRPKHNLNNTMVGIHDWYREYFGR